MFEDFCIDEVNHKIFNNNYDGIEELQESADSLRKIAISFEMPAPNCLQEIDQKIQDLIDENDILNNDEKEENKNFKKGSPVIADLVTPLSETKSMFNRLLSDLELLDLDQLTESIDSKL